jgi:enamine deaminase RidA (YjgF/YER057c/UK114 family)
MQKKLISTNSVFEKDFAYSRSVLVENTLYISGCTGYNYDTQTIEEDIVLQAEQTFKNIEFALKEADFEWKM